MKKNEFYKYVSPGEIESLLAETKTPCYIYFSRIIEKRYQDIRNCLPEGFQICFAVKANPNLQLLKILKDLGCGADTASLGEIKAAEEAGISPDTIEFSGPGKTIEELEYAVHGNLSSINIESLRELEKILGICRSKNKKANVGIRINPSKIPYSAAMKMGGDTQFGIPEEEIKQALSYIGTNKDHIEFTGFHMHLASQMLSGKTIVKHYDFVLSKVLELSREFNVKVEKINFGGGWGIDYFQGQKMLDLSEVKKGLSEVFLKKSYRDLFDGTTRMIAEPGRFLVGESGVYVSSVLYHKKGNKKNYLIIDGGMHQNYIAAGGMGQIIKRNFEIDILSKEHGEDRQKYTIAGKLCTPDDVLATDFEYYENVKEGDYVIIFNSGAYGYTASPLLFLSNTPPLEIVV